MCRHIKRICIRIRSFICNIYKKLANKGGDVTIKMRDTSVQLDDPSSTMTISGVDDHAAITSGGLPHNVQGFIHPRWRKTSDPSTARWYKTKAR